MSDYQLTSRPNPHQPIDGDDVTIERLPPADVPMEQALLGSCIIDGNCVAGVNAIIKTPDVFYREEHQIVWRVIADMVEKNEPLDGMTVYSKLKSFGLIDAIGGMPYFEQLVNSVPSSAHAEYYAGVIVGHWMRRKIIIACTDTLRDAYDEPDSPIELAGKLTQRMYDLNSTSATSGLRKIGGDRPETTHGIPTLFKRLDEKIKGLHRGEVLVIGARPSVGKSALLQNIMTAVGIVQKKPTALFTLEMKKHQVEDRIASAKSWVPASLFDNAKSMDDAQRDAFYEAITHMNESPVFISDDVNLNMMNLMSECRRYKKQHGLELVGVDYLQLMQASPGRREFNRQETISAISRGCKIMAGELDVCVVLLSQLNRVSAKEQRPPRLDDLRDAGAIEQDADTVLLLHRAAMEMDEDANPENYADREILERDGYIIIAKNRNGATGVVPMRYEGPCFTFRETRNGNPI